MGDCTHDIVTRGMAADDGYCPICLYEQLTAERAKVAKLVEELADAHKRIIHLAESEREVAALREDVVMWRTASELRDAAIAQRNQRIADLEAELRIQDEANSILTKRLDEAKADVAALVSRKVDLEAERAALMAENAALKGEGP